MAKEIYAMQNGGKKKRGRKPVFSANQFYPWSVEMQVKELVSSMLMENGKRLKEAAMLGYQADGLEDVNETDIFVPSDIKEKSEKIFREVENFSSRKLDEFAEKTVGRTLGYIPNQAKIRDDFVNNFVANCKSAAENQKKDIANAVYAHRMFTDGKKGSLSKEINDINKKYTKSKANFIARNETGNLNGSIQHSQIEGAGFEMYTWMCMPDGVTRDSHKALNGKVCRWDDPTVYSDDGGKTWQKRTGSMFIGEPGQDFNCRCTAVPFDPELDEDYSVKEMPEEEPEDREYVKNFEENLEKKSEEFAIELKKAEEKVFESTYPQTDEEKLAKAKASGLYNEHELNVLIPAMLSNKKYKKVNREKQDRHIVGTKIHKEYNQKSIDKNFAGEAFFDSDFNPYEEILQLVGTGVIVFRNDGFIIEELVKYYKDIGYAGGEILERTNVLSLRYSGTGIHATPVYRNKYDKKLKEKQKKH